MRHPTPEELSRLFQARMWRKFAQDWGSPGPRREWVERVLQIPRDECIRLARKALRK